MAQAETAEELVEELARLRQELEEKKAALEEEIQILKQFVGEEDEADLASSYEVESFDDDGDSDYQEEQAVEEQAETWEEEYASDSSPAEESIDDMPAEKEEEDVAEGPLGIGADLVSRYVWRGTDFGNSASVQPYIAYATGNLEIGAWSSWALTAAGAGANENDLYISYSAGPVGLTLTDYYFPESNKFFDYADDGKHILEISASLGVEAFSLMGAFNFRGDAKTHFISKQVTSGACPTNRR
jgi:hypothetical protein